MRTGLATQASLSTHTMSVTGLLAQTQAANHVQGIYQAESGYASR